MINSFNDIYLILFQTLHNLSPDTERCINMLEESTGITRENFAYGLVILTALYLMLGSGARFLCNIICFIYPAYRSLRKVDERSTQNALKWILYWTIFGAFTLIDQFADAINAVLPVYWLVKCTFFIYLFLPQTDGVNRFRDTILAPIFKLLHYKPREFVSLFELQVNRLKDINIVAQASDSTTSPIQMSVAKKVAVVRKAQIPIIFIIGAPGAGKGTQCAKMVEKYGLTHLSTGDLLRAEVESRAKEDDSLKKIMENGELVPPRIVLNLLKEAMSRATINGSRGFLIDGYPREIIQCEQFEQEVHSPDLVIYFEADQKTLYDRCVNRQKIRGQFDGSSEIIQKRLKTYEIASTPVVDYYDRKGKLVKIVSKGTVEDVFAIVETHLDKIMSKFHD
ncbi:Adenylate kinase isoenzyme [Dirofilaria immitis]